MNTVAKRYPWSKFSWTDWENDPALEECSYEAQGVWMRLLCRMHASEREGFLSVNGRPQSEELLSRRLGLRIDRFRRVIEELKSKGVCSVTADGIIYSRRMVRDVQARERDVANGSKGGNPKLTKTSQKTLDKIQNNDDLISTNSDLIQTNSELIRDNEEHIGGNQPQNEDRGLTLDIRDKNKEIRSKNSTPYSPPQEGGLVEVEPEPSKSKRTRQQTSLAITEPIPDWMPMEAWNGYLEMRVKTRNKPTERAISLAIKKLDGFRQQGHSVEEVLNQSTFRNWTGLFPVKQGHARTQSNVYAFNRPKGHFETVEEISKADDIGTMDDLKAMDEIARQRGVRIGAWRH